MRATGRLALVPALAAVVSVAPVDALDLQTALERARVASPVLRTAAAELDAAKGRLRQARLLQANPVLSADLARHTAPGGEEEKDRGVQLEQEIEVGGQRGLRIGAGEHDVTRAEQLLVDRRRTVEADVRRAFFGLAAAERRGALAAERVSVAARLVDASHRRAAAGEIGALDARLAEVESARAAQDKTAADIARARAEQRLALAIGAEPDETLGVVVEDPAPPPLPAEDALVARALEVRPDLAAAREERARLESEADLAARRGTIPNPVLRGFYRQELLGERIAGGGVSVPLPIFNREQGTRAALLAAAHGAAAEEARLKAQVPRDVHLALAHRRAAEETWRRYEREALPAATHARDLLEHGYDAGYLSLSDVLVQRDRLLQVRAGAIDAWLDLHEAEADVIEAAGGVVP